MLFWWEVSVLLCWASLHILLKSFDYGRLLNTNVYPLNTKKHFHITWLPTKLLNTSLYFFPNTTQSQQHLLFHTDCLYFFYLVAAPYLVMMPFFLEYFQNTFIGLDKTRQGSRIFWWHLEITYKSHILLFWTFFNISNCCFCFYLWLVQALWHR